MYALADNSLVTFSMLLAIEYSPYRRLSMLSQRSTITHQPTLRLLPNVLRIIAEFHIFGGPLSILEFLLGLMIGFMLIPQRRA